MKKVLIALLLSTKAFGSAEFSLGTRTSFFLESNKFDNSFVFAQTDYTYENYDKAIGLKLNFDVRAFDYYSSDEKVIVDPINLSSEFLYQDHRFQIGFVRYRFSETFGVQLLDIANPRDYSEFIFNDLSWSKRSVFGLNHSIKKGNFETQFILTLWPNGDRLPYKYSAFNEEGFYEGGVVERSWFKDYEYGFRTKYLFESGLDLSLLYFHHFARNVPGLDKQVDSFGMALSYVAGDWVIRSDTLFTIDDYHQKNFTTVEKKSHFQTLWGIDRVWDDLTLGLQAQFDLSFHRHYVGSKLELSSFENWTPSLMIFKNIQREDYWLQVKNSLELEPFNLSVVYDSFGGAKTDKDVFGHYAKLDRFLLEVSASY